LAVVICEKRQLNSVQTDDTIDWAPDAADPDADTSALTALFPRDSFARALAETGFSDVTVKATFINQPVKLKMCLGRLPTYSTARDVRVAVQRAMKSSGLAVARDGFLLRLHTGRITAKFRVAKRRAS
jgi:hypothetical protein